MVTYSVRCGYCQKEMLIEHSQPLPDPGTLPAFCSSRCSKEFFFTLHASTLQAGVAVIETLPCGCLCAIYSTQGSGHGMFWPMCAEAKSNYAEHSNACFKEAIAIIKRDYNDI